MSFNSNGSSTTYPIGSIISYVGNSDPDGWLICDGRAFTAISSYNTTDLQALLGSATSLPDLRSRTLVGSSSENNTRIYSSNTSTNYTLTESDLPKHFHNLTINNDVHANVHHNHTYNDLLHADSGGNNESPDTGDQTSYGDQTIQTSSTSHNHTANAFSSTGSGTAINFLNKCYTVNWIIKY